MLTTPRQTEHSSTTCADKIPRLRIITERGIDADWNEIAPLLQKAIDLSCGETTLRSEYEKLKRGETRLWAVTIGGRILAAATTYFQDYPRKRVVVVGILGGERMDLWLHFQPEMIEWARDHGATALQAEVRPGLVRKLNGLGWKKVRTIIRKDF